MAGCRHSSVDLSAPSIQQPQIRVPSTPLMLLSFKVKVVWYLSLHCEKNENKLKGRFWPIFEKTNNLSGNGRRKCPCAVELKSEVINGSLFSHFRKRNSLFFFFKSLAPFNLPTNSVTRLGYFINFLAANFCTKVAQKFGIFFGNLKPNDCLNKNFCSYILGNVW